MKRWAWLFAVGAFCTMTGSAGAQAAPTTFRADGEGIEITPPDSATPEDSAEKSRAYEKRVGGLVWLEVTAGPSRFDATRFRTLDIIPSQIQSAIPRVVVSGPEVGGALRFRAGSSTIGARFKRADYEPFDLTSVGLDLGFLIRAVPYVHPSIRLAFNYHTTTGGLVIPGFENVVSNVRSQGGGATIGAGLRIPIVKWVSIAADFDYSIIGLVFHGTENLTGGSFTAGTAGTAIAGTFALTFHLGS
ncbi:MAG: hypothetical protein AMJ62_05605 [Myxococcales bacterium SG8_38]|nr:MAG: hypothetical protein AMJ62_05605 [Myxococcales bacterium SG8_38]